VHPARASPRTRTPIRIAIVENTAITHHGQVGVALHEAAAKVDLWRPFRDGALPAPGSFDALIVFGGEQSARDDGLHPYLPRLGALMAETAAQGRAVLGICLGAQVFARGLGAENHLGAAPEFGWCEVRGQSEATGDALLGALPGAFRIPQWHSDTFDLPPGAAHLARSGVAAVQAFRFGRAGYGCQFHFEANRAVMRDWHRTFPAPIARLAPGWDHAAEEARHGAAADRHGLAIARAWVALV
jgi:GMP synthase-like glutamine amidotransferase